MILLGLRKSRLTFILVDHNPNQLFNLQEMNVAVESSKSLDAPTKMNVGAESSKSVGTPEFGSCTHAKRSCGEKYGDGIASDDCNLTQFSFSKLGKQIKRE